MNDSADKWTRLGMLLMMSGMVVASLTFVLLVDGSELAQWWAGVSFLLVMLSGVLLFALALAERKGRWPMWVALGVNLFVWLMLTALAARAGGLLMALQWMVALVIVALVLGTGARRRVAVATTIAGWLAVVVVVTLLTAPYVRERAWSVLLATSDQMPQVAPLLAYDGMGAALLLAAAVALLSVAAVLARYIRLRRIDNTSTRFSVGVLSGVGAAFMFGMIVDLLAVGGASSQVWFTLLSPSMAVTGTLPGWFALVAVMLFASIPGLLAKMGDAQA